MSVSLIYRDGSSKKYEPEKGLEEQLKDVATVKIDCSTNDGKVETFLNQTRRLLELNLLNPFDLAVNHGNTVKGARARKSARELEKKMLFSWAAREIIMNQERVEKKLTELSVIAKNAIKR